MPPEDIPAWWRKPRRITVVVDNPNWILPHAHRLVEEARRAGDHARLLVELSAVEPGEIAFFLNCHARVPEAVLARHRRNLVVHASRLPRGRGMSPWVWQILEGARVLPLTLFEAVAELDAGPIYRTVEIPLEGHELVDELRRLIGDAAVDLCRWFLDSEHPPAARPQIGEPSFYRRRTPEDSRLDPSRSIAEQFELLRVVDNDRYPAFFDLRGARYLLRIEKVPPDDNRVRDEP